MKPLSGKEMGNKKSPELARFCPAGYGLVVPSKMLATITAKGETPLISGKPGVLLGRCPFRHHSWTRGESIEFKRNPGGVDKLMAKSPPNPEQAIRIGDQSTASRTLIGPVSIASDGSIR